MCNFVLFDMVGYIGKYEFVIKGCEVIGQLVYFKYKVCIILIFLLVERIFQNQQFEGSRNMFFLDEMLYVIVVVDDIFRVQSD